MAPTRRERADVVDDAELLAAAIANEDWPWPALLERDTGLVASITWSCRLGSCEAAEVRQEVWMRLFQTLHRMPIGSIGPTRQRCLSKLRAMSERTQLVTS